MQSAIARLLNRERTIKVEKKVYDNPLLVAVAWIFLMSWPVLLTGAEAGPTFILMSFGGIFLSVLLGAFWYNYINKK